MLRLAHQRERAGARGLEIALLLADVEFGDGRASAADQVLAETQNELGSDAAGARAALARGWFALGTRSPDAAAVHFATARAQSDGSFGRDLAALGQAWSALLATPEVSLREPLNALASTSRSPELRVAASLTLARAEQAMGHPGRALHALRRARGLARGSTLGDDIALAIALVQLDAGDTTASHRTLDRLAREAARSPGARRAVPAAPTEEGLTLDDLRLPPAAFAARLADLHAHRPDANEDTLRFFGRILDRDAATDVPAALALIEAIRNDRLGREN